jgi:hypothetical protein
LVRFAMLAHRVGGLGRHHTVGRAGFGMWDVDGTYGRARLRVLAALATLSLLATAGAASGWAPATARADTTPSLVQLRDNSINSGRTITQTFAPRWPPRDCTT